MKDIDIMAALAQRETLGPRRIDRGDEAEDDFGDIAFDPDPMTGVWFVHMTPRPRMGPPEDDSQARLFSWLRHAEGGRRHGLIAHSVPNDGATTRERVVALKRTGLTPGVCDLYVFGPMGNLAIEMKRDNGTPSDVQENQLGHLTSLAPFPGWTSCVCFGYRAARAAINRFLLAPGVYGPVRGMAPGTVASPSGDAQA